MTNSFEEGEIDVDQVGCTSRNMIRRTFTRSQAKGFPALQALWMKMEPSKVSNRRLKDI